MSKVTIESLVESDVFRNAIPRSTDAELAGLERLIEESGQCLMPVLYQMDNAGVCHVVDGYSRLDIYKRRPEIFQEPPRVVEIQCLCGASDEAVIQWIIQHQAFRRNNESLIKRYFIGKMEGKSEEIGQSHDMTGMQVRHARLLADAVDRLEESEPGIRDEILESDISANAVLTAAKTGNTEPVRQAIASGRGRVAPNPLGHFKAAKELLGKLARGIGKIENETTSNEWSEKCKDLMNALGHTLDEWESSEAIV